MAQATESPSNKIVASAVAGLLGVPYLVPVALLTITIAGLLGGCLIGQDRLAFRDVSHFYTPLYGYIAARERVEWLPLYNDLDHCGIPLAGETTTAIFYPIRRIVFRVFDSPETAIAWYVALHLLLAGITAAWAARRSSATTLGASIAMLAYPLSGPIWFLYTNPPFLVGAAWLPLALAGGFSLLSGFRFRDLSLVSAALAMMILAGDPQTAIHVILIGVIAWIFRTVTLLIGSQEASLQGSLYASICSLFRLTTALLLAVFLAAPQIAASMDWAPQSVRYGNTQSETLTETFAFSVAPWHWAELILPSISGSLFPQYTRISHLVPGDGRTWVITLYCGLIPLSFALLRYRRVFAKLRIRRNPFLLKSPRLDGWDSIAPIGLIFATGNLSLGAFIRWVQPSWLAGIDDLWCSPYGWLVALIPGYSGFRYPAKWLVFVPLGVAIAAARQAGHLSGPNVKAASRVALALAFIGFVAGSAIIVLLNILLSSSAKLPQLSDSIWGPLTYSAAGWGVATSVLALVCIAKLFGTASIYSLKNYKLLNLLVILIAVDLWMVAQASLATINRNDEAAMVESSGGYVPKATDRHPFAPSRAMRFSNRGWPERLRNTPSDGHQRILIAEASMRNSVFGRWHLADSVAVFNSPTSLPPARIRSFWTSANSRSRRLSIDQQHLHWNRIMQWLAIDQSWAVTEKFASTSGERGDQPILAIKSTPVLGSSPMIAWHNRWNEIAVAEHLTEAEMDQRLETIVSDTADSYIPWIESLEFPLSRKNRGESVVPAHNPLRSVSQSSPGNWRISIESPTEGLVTIKQYQDGNLHARLLEIDSNGTLNADRFRLGNKADSSRSVDVVRCDYLFSAIKVPPGHFELQVFYSPRWQTPSFIIAGLCWILLISVNSHPCNVRINSLFRNSDVIRRAKLKELKK